MSAFLRSDVGIAHRPQGLLALVGPRPRRGRRAGLRLPPLPRSADRRGLLLRDEHTRGTVRPVSTVSSSARPSAPQERRPPLRLPDARAALRQGDKREAKIPAARCKKGGPARDVQGAASCGLFTGVACRTAAQYNKYKLTFINDKVRDGESTTVYRCGPMIDLCVGPHVPDTSRIEAIKVVKVGGGSTSKSRV